MDKIPDALEKVVLETRDGKFVSEELIPKFRPAADVLLWGERYFQHHGEGIYREAFVWMILPNGYMLNL